ncbi:hypothetical protein A2U01_0103480, partial [Trifolium medium]|nr:hypothetical protein [Trifolium medium]
MMYSYKEEVKKEEEEKHSKGKDKIVRKEE